MTEHRHRLLVYYEDTDFTGAVYHSNYLKFFERAREHMIGIDRLARLHKEDGVGFVVYRAELKYRAPAFHSDELEIRSLILESTPYRIRFGQSAWRGDEKLVDGAVELACVGRDGKLIAVPDAIRLELESGFR